jgi:hypothetical protein
MVEVLTDGWRDGWDGWMNDTRSFPALDVSEFIAFDDCLK